MVGSVLDVAVLGRVRLQVDGRALEPGRAKSVELLVYLTMHPEGVDGDQLWEVLWPNRPMRPAVLHTVVSAARTSLSRAIGRPLLVSDARRGGIYRLADRPALDWHRFERLVSRARGDAGESEALREPLDLVRGPPFSTTAPAGYDWARGYRTEMEESIGWVAERLGLWQLERGDVLGARRAARQGLLAAPYDERLYRLLMLAAHQSEHPSGVDSVMSELSEALGVDPDGTDRRTLDLYRQLRQATGGSSFRLRTPARATAPRAAHLFGRRRTS